MTIFYSDMEPLSQYFPVKLHRSPATRFLSENPDLIFDSLVLWDIFMSLTVQIIYFGKPVGLFKKLIPFLPFSFFVTATLETSSRYGMLIIIINIFSLLSIKRNCHMVKINLIMKNTVKIFTDNNFHLLSS